MRRLYSTAIIGLAVLFSLDLAKAQVANDDCQGAIQLPISGEEYCSETAAFSLGGASPGSLEEPFCWPKSDPADIWFKFINQGTDVNIRVIGDVVNNSGGTLTQPQIALYSGSCTGGLVELGCNSDAFNSNLSEMYVNNLPLGVTLYIRIGSRNDSQGSFKLCINNFNLVPLPQSDCPTGVILCDKHAFSVNSVLGNGVYNNEIPGNGCINNEFSSAWYRWTCEEAGSLAFTITPSNPTDDIDFMVFELPGGLDDCANKTLLRCMAAGENVDRPYSTWAKCTGPTGLSLTSSDIEEQPGCTPSSDNFVRYVDMVKDKVYALMIMNFTNTGNGFSISFSGTGTFKGPKADFEILPNGIDSTFCWDDTLQIIDKSSSSAGPIVEWNWVFGENAVPAASNQPGDKSVWYDKSASKTVLLSVKNDEGCIVSKSQTVFLECCGKTVTVDAGEDGEVELGDSYQLQGAATLPGSDHVLQWLPPETLDDSKVYNPVCTPFETTQYQLVVYDEFNCANLDTVTVRVNKNYKTFIPNGFSPNDDGLNDFLPVFTNKGGRRIVQMRIYDRWGSLLWEGKNLALSTSEAEGAGWDGYSNDKRCNPGVYVYLVEVEYIDGEKVLYSGDVTLVR